MSDVTFLLVAGAFALAVLLFVVGAVMYKLEQRSDETHAPKVTYSTEGEKLPAVPKPLSDAALKSTGTYETFYSQVLRRKRREWEQSHNYPIDHEYGWSNAKTAFYREVNDEALALTREAYQRNAERGL